MTEVRTLERFVVLDSMRGIFACLVALYHLQSTSFIINNSFIQNSWMFVDFFFVLSGFVITASYGDRISNGYSVKDFLILRFGRIYPLHFVMLMAFLAMELAVLAFGAQGLSARAPFEDSRSVSALIASLLLVDIFGIHTTAGWNGPSWSIQAEMWAYLLAALAFRYATPVLRPIAIITIVASVCTLAFIGDTYLERTFSFALVRCMYGFALGVIAHKVYRAHLCNLRWSGVTGTVLELGSVAACGALVSIAGVGPLSLICPILFFVTLLIFTKESGLVSRILSHPLPILLGTLSYSIYMVNLFVGGRFIDVMTVIGRFLGVHTTIIAMEGGFLKKALDLPGIFNELAPFIMLLAVILFAWITYRFIETPFRDWTRRLVQPRDSARANCALPQS